MTSSKQNNGALGICPVCKCILSPRNRSESPPIVCDRCKKTLWFLATSEEIYYYEMRLVSNTVHHIAVILAPVLKADYNQVSLNLPWIDDLINDPLDYVEVIMALDETFPFITDYFTLDPTELVQMVGLNKYLSEYGEFTKWLNKAVPSELIHLSNLSQVIKYIVDEVGSRES